MKWITWIEEALYAIHVFFFRIYSEVNGWFWPFSLAADFFYQLSIEFYKILESIWDFEKWVDVVVEKIAKILSSLDILKLIKLWFPWLSDIGEWFSDVGSWLTTMVEGWWGTVSETVLGWVQGAKDLATSLISEANKAIDSLQVGWSNFWNITLPELNKKLNDADIKLESYRVLTETSTISKTDATDLMDSKIKDASPGWSGWTDVKDSVVLFFTKPLDWLVGQLEDWFWGVEK